MCDQCSHNHSSDRNNGGFIFGLILGAILGAVIAIIIYKNDKDKVTAILKEKIDTFLKSVLPDQTATQSAVKTRKLSTSITAAPSKPEVVAAVSGAPVPARKSPPKKFFKPRK